MSLGTPAMHPNRSRIAKARCFSHMKGSKMMVCEYGYACYFALIDDILTDHPLAQGFNILDGHVVIQVPKVSPGKKYAVVRECMQIIHEFIGVLTNSLMQSLATQETILLTSRKFFCLLPQDSPPIFRLLQDCFCLGVCQ